MSSYPDERGRSVQESRRLNIEIVLEAILMTNSTLTVEVRYAPCEGSAGEIILKCFMSFVLTKLQNG